MVAPGEALLPEDVKSELINYIMEHREEIENSFDNMMAGEWCQGVAYAAMHKYVWVDDPNKSMNDIVNFFWRFGFPNAYKALKNFYTTEGCPQEIIDMIPDGPIAPQQSSDLSDRSSNIREQVLLNQTISESESLPFPLPKIQMVCDIAEILTFVKQSGLLDLVILLDTTIHEVIQQPSIHFLTGKIQEPAKGDSFSGLRALEVIRSFFFYIDQVIKIALQLIPVKWDEDTMINLIQYIKRKFLIDLCKLNIVELVVSLFELVMWGKLEIGPIFGGATCPEIPTTTAPPFYLQ